MIKRTAFVDERIMAGGFATGDVVRKTGLRDLLLSPYVGRVLYSNPETGKVAVQWPWGSEQESPVELVKDTSKDYVPPVGVDQSYSTWESSRHTHDEGTNESDSKWRKSVASSVVIRYEQRTLPIWRAACKAWHHGLEEFDAFKRINASLGADYGDDAIRITVANLYELGRRLAIYWGNKKRQYRVTQREKSSGATFCPRCKFKLKPRVFRQGQRVLQCKNCGFSIHPEDLF